MRKQALFLLLCIVAITTACPRYDAVRRMSTEQLAVQDKLKINIEDYFKAIDKLLDQQVTAAAAAIDEITQRRIDRRNEQLSLTLKTIPLANDDDRRAKIDENSEKIADITSFGTTKKQQINDYVVLIKAKHQEIIQAYKDMYAAQQTLDEYIQLKKADEVIAENIANKFKLNQEKISNATNAATNAALELAKLTGQKLPEPN